MKRLNSMPMAPALLTRVQAAGFLNMSPRQFDRLKGTMIAVVAGSAKRLYDPADLLAWAETRKVAPTKAVRRRSGAAPVAAASESLKPAEAKMLEWLRRGAGR